MSKREHINKGRCAGHPRRKLEAGKKHCALCTSQAKARSAKRILLAKQLGVCYNHPDRKVPEGTVRCFDCLISIRLWNLKQRGLKEEELKKAESAFREFNNSCQACGVLSPGKRGWCIDHNHADNTFRGILCTNCNVAIGMLGDSPERALRVAVYLNKA